MVVSDETGVQESKRRQFRSAEGRQLLLGSSL